jgi:hypothetical protein
VWINDVRVFTNGAVNLGTTALGPVMVGAEHFAQEGDLFADDIVIKSTS